MKMSPPPEKKRKIAATTLPSESITFQALPDDLIMSIVARVPREYYPTLSLVCKSFRSLTVSPELYNARSLSGHTESCLYLCVECDDDHQWFTLIRKPDQSGYLLARVPIPYSPPAKFWNLVTVGSDIYNIAGSKSTFSRSVSILDCRSHTWSFAPNLGVELTAVSASAHDGKIYVVGKYVEEGYPDKKNIFQVLETKTQTWHPLPSNCSSETKGMFAQGSNTEFVDGELIVMPRPRCKKCVAAYNLKEAKWKQVDWKISAFTNYNSYCQIDNVMYSDIRGLLRWYDTEVCMWRTVVGLPPHFFYHGRSDVKLVNFRGKIAAFWVENFPCDCCDCDNETDDGCDCDNDTDDDCDCNNGKNMVCCAVIALERRNTGEICGVIEWLDHVLTVPKEAYLVKALAPTV